ncbi:antitoxin Xre/MbcA/ParS toxin-binding domain-containing protein [Bradyrhizobium sp. Ce-3]|uniref:type II RES/Xre toxin-antitoxin system antitoxin n=1 Tax=Bradyrhizobium sp. Ce-3 TaxID=2913970 RepID=UPI001FC7BD58|nr:antitoxin Xre/MbcA/ParS toxin-binding domain-containing protein [Bradyrhizobium sp. Ce-3]GKQ53579.1 antitoxin [Bradyrhizobium sp. Ce-3]
MTRATEKSVSNEPGNDLQKVVDLLGGPRILFGRITSLLDAHEMLLDGLPRSALNYLVHSLIVIDKADALEKAVGISLGPCQRRKSTPAKLLSQEQSARTWKFAEILAKATDVFGSQKEAEQWLRRPAIGLDRRYPIDLLATPVGIELIEQHLARLAYGVYS